MNRQRSPDARSSRLAAIGWMVLVASSVTVVSADENWPRFRGPNGAGISRATTIPSSWTADDYNWKISLPGVGHSSPVVWGDRIYLTSGDPDSATRLVLCLATEDGHLMWRKDYPSHTFKQHRSNSYATATPAADADGVVVTWTTPEEVVLLSLDRDGKEVWRRNLGTFVGPHGSGTSPIIVGDLVILHNTQEDMRLLSRLMGRENPTAPVGQSFLIAVDRHSGETRWKLVRRTALVAYSTPCVRRPQTGAPELIMSSTAQGISAVDLGSGRVTWELPDVFSDRCVASPIVAGQLVVASYGHGVHGSLCLAARPGSSTPSIPPGRAYEVTQSVPLVPTPLAHDGLLFLWADTGVVTCLRCSTGEVVWRERVGGSFFGSPVCVGGRLYCIAKNGEVFVLAAADQYKLLARVALGEESFSTPAVARGVMYLRTRSHLLSLGGH